jgi:ribosomal protein S18 acetylase RimI-like enzyme
MTALHHRPERMLVPGLDGYPAHLHIDLLPAYQGRGHGRRLVERFAAAAGTAGATGVHVAMVTANVRARGFYDRLGFGVLPVPEPGPLTYLGLRIGT